MNRKKKPKTFSQPQQNNQNPDSITEVHFIGFPRKSVSFKCNEKLWKTFVSTIKAQGLSVCHILEPIIYGWLEGKVHLSNTIRPIHFGNLIVERAVKRVRRYAVEDVTVSEVKKKVYCPLNDCFVPLDSLALPECAGCGTLRCLGKEVLSDG